MFYNDTYNKLKVQLDYKPTQSSIYMNNKYLRILNQMVNSKKLKKSHMAFTYSYLYLMSYLFRYTKYDNVQLDLMHIKEILQYNPNYKLVNYIVKKDGLLDSEGLTETLYDFPVVHEVKDYHLEFTMLSTFNDGQNSYGSKWRELHGMKYNASCKYPVLGFYRDVEDYKIYGMQLEDCGGSFYNTEDTTMIPIEVFMYCMSHSELGTVGFYLYCYIAYHVQLHSNCHISLNELSINTNLSYATTQKYLNILRQYNLIHTVVADYFIVGGNKNVKAEPNTHFTNSHDEFVMDNLIVELQKPNYLHVSKVMKIKQTLDTTDFS